MNPHQRGIAQIPSITNVRESILIRSLTTPEGDSSPKPPAQNIRCRRPTRSLISREKDVVAVITPSPPSWIRSRRTIWEASVKSLPVSTTVKPVTQTAEVAVKRASTTLKGCGPALNSKRRKDPEPISVRKPSTIFLSMGSEV